MGIHQGQVLPFASGVLYIATMARPLRIEFSNALYHITSRGDGYEAIYLIDKDRLFFFEEMSEVYTRFNWVKDLESTQC